MPSDQNGPYRLFLDKDGFERFKRLALFEIANSLVNIQTDIQKTLELRPEASQIYMIIAISAIQRYVRDPKDGTHNGSGPLPDHLSSTISRRRVADATGIPRETVARNVRHLIDRGLVIELGSGKLTTPSGVLRDLDPTELLDRMALEVTKLAQKLARLGVLGIETDDAVRVAACHSAP